MIRRLVAPAVGIVLIGLVLWQVGWRDRLLDRSGQKHVGRIEARDSESVTLRIDDELKRFEKPLAVREGLLTAFGRLADHPGLALIGVCLHLLGLVLVFVRWSVLLRGAGLAMPMRQVIRLSWVGQFFGVVLPGGVGTGDVIRAVYTAREHPGRRARAVVTVFVDRVIGLVVLCAIATIAVLVSPRLAAFDRVRVVVLVILAGAVGTAVVLFSARVRNALQLTRLLRRLPFSR